MRTLTIAALLLLPAAGRAEDGPFYVIELRVSEVESRDLISRPTFHVLSNQSARMCVGQTVKVAGRDEFAGLSATVTVIPTAGGTRLDLRVDYTKLVEKAGRSWLTGSPANWQRVVQPGVPARFLWRPTTGPAIWVEATVTARE